MTDLIATLEGLTGPSALVDAEIYATIGSAPHTTYAGSRKVPLIQLDDPETWPAYTASLDAATALVERVLPGWTWRVATCHVSDDAWVIPDFNHPVHGERLMREFGQVEGDPSAYWQEITDVDLRPSGRPAIALCIALIRALEARDGTE